MAADYRMARARARRPGLAWPNAPYVACVDGSLATSGLPAGGRAAKIRQVSRAERRLLTPLA